MCLHEASARSMAFPVPRHMIDEFTQFGHLALGIAQSAPRLCGAKAARSACEREGTSVKLTLMEELVTAVRNARPEDAGAVARVYIASWHDTYPSILPAELLCAMTPRGQTARWHAAILARGGEQILVAECAKHGIVGMASFGAAHDRGLGFDGEVYTLYVDPDFIGLGIGSTLMRAAFGGMHNSSFTSCVIWAHARNPARFFYEAMGGRLIAERSRRMMGSAVPEAAYGWRRLALSDRNEAPGGSVSRH